MYILINNRVVDAITYIIYNHQSKKKKSQAPPLPIKNIKLNKYINKTNFLIYIGNKNKKYKKRGPKQQQSGEQQSHEGQDKLSHHIDILASFNEMKIPIPLLLSELENTVKLLQEKKKYYQDQPKPEKSANNQKGGTDNK